MPKRPQPDPQIQLAEIARCLSLAIKITRSVRLPSYRRVRVGEAYQFTLLDSLAQAETELGLLTSTLEANA